MSDRDRDYVPTVSERKKSLLGQTSPDRNKEKSNPILNNFSIKPIIQFFNRKLKRDGKKGSLKVERRKKLVMDKEYHSDTFVVETNFECNKLDDNTTGNIRGDAAGHLERKLYHSDKDKRSSLYSNFDDVNFNFVFNEEVFNEGRDEEINFGSDSDNEESLDYEEFLFDGQKDSDSELFQELLDEVGLDYLPLSKAPTVSQDEDSEAESEILISSQEVGLFQKVILDVTTCNSEPEHSLTLPHTETEAESSQEDQEVPKPDTQTKSQLKSSNENGLGRTEDSLDELRALSTETRKNIKEMSTLVIAKDELTEKSSDAKSVTNTNDTTVNIQMSEDDEVPKENIVEDNRAGDGDTASENSQEDLERVEPILGESESVDTKEIIVGVEEDRWDSQDADDVAGGRDGEDKPAGVVSVPCENPPVPPSVDVTRRGERGSSHGQAQVPSPATVIPPAPGDIHAEQQSQPADLEFVPTNIIHTSKNSVNLLSETSIMKDDDSVESLSKTRETNEERMTKQTEEQHDPLTGDNHLSEDEVLSQRVIKENDSGNFTEMSLDSNDNGELGNITDHSDNSSVADSCHFNDTETKFVNTDIHKDETTVSDEDHSHTEEESVDCEESNDRVQGKGDSCSDIQGEPTGRVHVEEETAPDGSQESNDHVYRKEEAGESYDCVHEKVEIDDDSVYKRENTEKAYDLVHTREETEELNDRVDTKEQTTSVDSEKSNDHAQNMEETDKSDDRVHIKESAAANCEETNDHDHMKEDAEESDDSITMKETSLVDHESSNDRVQVEKVVHEDAADVLDTDSLNETNENDLEHEIESSVMDDFTCTDDEKENLALNARPRSDTIQPVTTISPPLVYVSEEVYLENLEHDDSVEFDKSFNIDDLNQFEADTVSELDTRSEYNSPYSKLSSRIPRINRSNSCMSFKRRCSLQSLPHNSSRRSSISSRRSSTLSIDERPPWNYGAGGSPYQKLYPFGKRKRLSVDNYYN